MGKLLCMTGLLTGVASEPVVAQASPSPRHAVSIGRMNLAQALRLFSRQTGRQVGFPPALVRRKTASSVEGRFDPDTALERLLEGTGLAFRAMAGGYVLRPKPVIAPIEPRVVAATEVHSMRPDSDIVVVGTRLDGGDSTDIKRRALQSISVLTDVEIRNAPDTSLAEIVRRIPGLQLSTRAGGGIVTIRGLSQTEDRLNGRNLTSTVFRGFDIAALPSDIVSGVDVYKTSSASQIEGGIGGVIDFHTRRPFDVEGSGGSITAKGADGDLDDRLRPYVSGHLSTRDTTSIGEIGLLVGGSRQVQDIAGDIFRIDTNEVRSTVTSRTIDAPANAIKRRLRGTKSLTTGYASAQWRPTSSIEFTGDALYNRSALDFTNTSLVAQLADGVATGPFDLDPTDGIVRTGRWTGVPLRSSTSRGTGHFDTYQQGVSARYEHGPATVLVDVSRTRTSFRYSVPSLSLAASAPEVAYESQDGLPHFTVAGIDPTNPISWRFIRYTDILAADDNAETAGRFDGIYKTGGVFQSLKAGAQITRRTVGHRFVVRTVGAGNEIVAVQGSGFTTSGGERLFGRGYPQPRWVAPSGDMLGPGSVGTIRSAFGLDPQPPTFNPQLGYAAVETIASGYLEATFGILFGGIPFDGNVGLRYAKTRLSIVGRTSSDTDVRTSNSSDRRYGHWLPSINLRAELAPRLHLRLAWSRQISRPPFEQLAPTVTLDFVNATGDAGNPLLKALHASQYDLAVERYFARGGNLYAAAFYKKVSGFIGRQATSEFIDGRPFLVSRPVNADDGWIRGVEIGYSQRFGFLPGSLSGLGTQASYTFVNSSRVDNGAAFRVPLEQMSRNNYTVAATYDRGMVKAGLTWIWRSRLLEVSRGDALGRPLYRNPYGQLDANISVNLTPRLSASASVLNALRRRTIEYFEDERRLNQTFVESRRILLGLTLRSGGDP